MAVNSLTQKPFEFRGEWTKKRENSLLGTSIERKALFLVQALDFAGSWRQGSLHASEPPDSEKGPACHNDWRLTKTPPAVQTFSPRGSGVILYAATIEAMR